MKLKILSLLLLLGACATPKKTDKKQEPAPEGFPTTQETGPSEELSLPPDLSAQDIDPPPVDTLIEDTPREAPKVGVWIEGLGLESYAALGFLQELEKKGLKIQRVAGTGYACWIALSWALENSPNQAEWQAFKWSDWQIIGRKESFLARLTSNSWSLADFSSQLQRLYSPKEFNELRLDADCPLLNTDGRFVSAKSRGIASALWEQLQHPLFFNLEKKKWDQAKVLSGIYGSLPTLADLSSLPGESVDTWIVIRTVPSAHRFKDHWVASALSQRLDKAIQESAGPKALLIDWSRALAGEEKKLTHFDERRRFLLKGRELSQGFSEQHPQLFP